MAASQVCPYCSNTQVEAVGNEIVCTRCSRVIETTNIVSDITFGENSAGAAVVTGQFVAHDQAHANVASVHGTHGESRAQTINKARIRIENMAHRLGVNESIVGTAMQYFKLALTYNFVKGRRSIYVQSACLYLACRKTQWPVMLMDFAELASINVFYIGATYFQLLCNLKVDIRELPDIDPSIYIPRFAAQLSFGQQGTNAVKEDAIKVVKRMGKDWLFDGRKPAGIAAAAVLIAARMNNFRRSPAEIVYVAKIGIDTLHRRLTEFKSTGVGDMTVDAFRKDSGEDVPISMPPSFQRLRELEKKLIKRQAEEAEKFERGEEITDVMLELEEEVNEIEVDKQTSELTSQLEETLRDPNFQAASEAEAQQKNLKLGNLPEEFGFTKGRRKVSLTSNISDKNTENGSGKTQSVSEIKDSTVEKEKLDASSSGDVSKNTNDDDDIVTATTADVAAAAANAVVADVDAAEGDSADNAEVDTANNAKVDWTDNANVDKVDNTDNTEADNARVDATNTAKLDTAEYAEVDNKIDTASKGEADTVKDPGSNKAMPSQSSRKRANYTWTSKVRDDNNFSDVDDEEVESMLLDVEEIAIKSRVWMTLNRDYLIEQENKRLKEQAEKKNDMYKATKRRRKGKKDSSQIQSQRAPTSAAESASNMIQQRAFSRKLNYSAIETLFKNGKRRDDLAGASNTT